MAVNIWKAGARKGGWLAIAFGVLYTAFQLWALSLLPDNTGLTIGFSVGGAAMMQALFWNRYLGKETKYCARPIWVPLLIGIVVFGSLIFFVLTTIAPKLQR